MPTKTPTMAKSRKFWSAEVRYLELTLPSSKRVGQMHGSHAQSLFFVGGLGFGGIFGRLVNFRCLGRFADFGNRLELHVSG